MPKKINPLNLSKVSYKDSPNKSARAGGESPSVIVLHHTGPGSFNGIVNWLRNPQAKASAHYVLGTAGQLTQLVNSRKKAWHAGVSEWNGRSNVNQFSIGIEICNIGRLVKIGDKFFYEQGRNLKEYTGKVRPKFGKIANPDGQVLAGYYVPYPDKQIDKLVALCKALIVKYPKITKENIITHYQVSPGRKNDPFGLDLDVIKDMIFER